jgi:hypothetical protein
VTGSIVETPEEAIRALPGLLALDRNAVRRRFESRFTATRMAHDYVKLYRASPEAPLRDRDGKGRAVPSRSNRINGNGKQSHFD